MYFTGDFEFVSTSSDWLHHIEARLTNTVLVVKLGRRQFLLQRSNVCVLYRKLLNLSLLLPGVVL